MPSSCDARTTRRRASTPRRWPSARGKPRAAAQRPLPSMMMATCAGASDRSGPSVAGAAALDMTAALKHDPDPKGRVGAKCAAVFRKDHARTITQRAMTIHRALDGEDFFFLGGQQLVDLGDRAVGRLLDLVGVTFLIVLRHLVILLELLQNVEAVAADVTRGDLGRLRVFVRDLDELLAPLLVEL